MEENLERLVNWIEIPVLDFARAIAFYEEILQTTLQTMEINNTKYALFPTNDRFNSGSLVQSENHKPSLDGVNVYFDGGTDMNQLLIRVELAGGKILLTKTYVGEEAGHIGMFLDSEGNKIGIQQF
ncbi:VOC family protein [Leptospira terpstrae]|uniref:VOC family protein n=1 Tax=Leptospira terpstrae TaxID=293075 RepID=UPI003D05F65D